MALSITDIDAKIQTLIDSQQVDWQEGDIRVSASQKIEQLMRLREHLVKNPDAEIELAAFDIDINEFGQDDSQYVL